VRATTEKIASVLRGGMEKRCEFSTQVQKVGINPCVAIPESVSACLGKRGIVPVWGSLNGVEIRATLVPIGGGRHRLYINGEMRKKTASK
jgi:hypothetical protein